MPSRKTRSYCITCFCHACPDLSKCRNTAILICNHSMLNIRQEKWVLSKHFSFALQISQYGCNNIFNTFLFNVECKIENNYYQKGP